MSDVVMSTGPDTLLKRKEKRKEWRSSSSVMKEHDDDDNDASSAFPKRRNSAPCPSLLRPQVSVSHRAAALGLLRGTLVRAEGASA